MSTTRTTGDFGERVAKDYLVARDFFILAKKYYTRFGEIDIVAWDKKRGELVFVEVKTRTSTQFGWPEESVNARKKERFRKSARVYLEKKYDKGVPHHRFDIVAILIDKISRKAQVYHFKNIEM